MRNTSFPFYRAVERYLYNLLITDPAHLLVNSPDAAAYVS